MESDTFRVVGVLQRNRSFVNLWTPVIPSGFSFILRSTFVTEDAFLLGNERYSSAVIYPRDILVCRLESMDWVLDVTGLARHLVNSPANGWDGLPKSNAQMFTHFVFNDTSSVELLPFP